MNRDAGTLDPNETRVVIDGKVIDSDGKSDGSWNTTALENLEADRWVAEDVARMILPGALGPDLDGAEDDDSGP